MTTELSDKTPYRVLARKYRPLTFKDLVGQDVLVKTLTTSLRTGKIAHAFMLTGVRGVGKTTTARIMARALNCTGNSATAPVTEPCGTCDSCVAITQDRYVDVIEIDAASHTGVDNIREIIDGVRYAPVAGRYKVYIIDEVHMLSKSAFNALLKTLEEPPSHVKFIFATTEIRKVPVTILSRCQRFDLPRVDLQTLARHFTSVAQCEKVDIEPGAVALLARAADGSVRDGLSLLDRAIAVAEGTITETHVRDMLGLADQALILDVYEAAVTSRPKEALELVREMNRRGADPLILLQDLLNVTHVLTRLKVVPDLKQDVSLPEDLRARGSALAEKLGIPRLSRAWHILLKGLDELQRSPWPLQALEMAIIRLAYTTDMPTPGDVIRKLDTDKASGLVSSAVLPASEKISSTTAFRSVSGASRNGSVAVAARPASAPDVSTQPSPEDFRSLVTLFSTQREGVLYGLLYSAVHLVRLEPGRLEIRPTETAPPTLASRVSACLSEWTGQRWVVTISREAGEPTLAEQDKQNDDQIRQTAAQHPLVQQILSTFPGASIKEVRQIQPATLPVPSHPATDLDEDAPLPLTPEFNETEGDHFS